MNVTKLTPFCIMKTSQIQERIRLGARKRKGREREGEEGRYKINRGKEGRKEEGRERSKEVSEEVGRGKWGGRKEAGR